MFTQKRRSRPQVLEVLDTRLALSGFGGMAAAQVSMATPAGYVQLNPQPLPPRLDPSGINFGANIADKLNPQPLPPKGGGL
jgi:hypothetical protein